MPNPAHSLHPVLLSITRLVLGLEKVYAGLVILLCTGAFLDLYANAGYGSVTRIRFYLWKLLVIGAIAFIIVRWKKVMSQIPVGKFLLAFLAFMWISRYWSIAPFKTAEETVKIIETTILGIYIATRYNFKEQTKLLTFIFSISAVLSLFYVFAMPNMGKMYGAGVSGDLIGTWRGIYLHKNLLGRVMTIGGIFLILQPLTSKKYRLLGWLIFFISFQLIVGTNSKTALVGFLFLVGISPIARVFRWNPSVGIPLYLSAMMIGGVGAVFLGDNWDAALASIDKDPTLNGRLPIWEIMVERIEERPWLGYGYKAFWQGWQGKFSAPIWRTIVWKPDHAHNGFIDLMVDFGVLGTLIFALAFLDCILKSINRIRFTGSLESLWPLGFMTFYVIMNQTQTALVHPYSIQWLIFVLISFTPISDHHQDPQPEPVCHRLYSDQEIARPRQLKYGIRKIP